VSFFRNWENSSLIHSPQTGPNLDDTDDHKNTLIHISHSYYFCHLAKSTNVNAENVHGETALFTCSTPTAEDLDCLFEQNANVTHVSKAGLTPLHNALLTKNRVLLLKLLQDHIAKLGNYNFYLPKKLTLTFVRLVRARQNGAIYGPFALQRLELQKFS
jgi:ankyrin repeat protein